MLMKLNTGILLVLLTLFSHISEAHQTRLAYLDIKALDSERILINWTRPLSDGQALSIHPVFPVHCYGDSMPQSYQLSDVVLDRWEINCGSQGITGEVIVFTGLSNTLTSVLLKYQTSNGAAQQKMLNANDATFMVPQEITPGTSVVWDYLRLGVQHILGGIDHLLFILCLLLITHRFWNVLKTVTAFTLAHSLTLGLAVLGYVQVPPAFVEAAIALSILVLAAELVRARRSDIVLRSPWFVAFSFGLLHGLGFAGALTEIGLPATDLPLALLMFNIGVEIGQMLFIGAALLAFRVLHTMGGPRLAQLRHLGAYCTGTVAAFWLIERVIGFY